MRSEVLYKQIPLQHLSPEKRVASFAEVSLGYTEAQALAEAGRCLQCNNPSCIKGCPVGIDIPGFIQLITEGKYQEAIMKIKENNNLPAICGRVCPQEDQCQRNCCEVIDDVINIGGLERFVADWELANSTPLPNRSPSPGKAVAVVGSGPAGLTVAAELAKMGHHVILFEALHKPGGVLTYGIPEFRLPKNIVKAEVDYIKKLGVEIELNRVIGRTMTVDDLFNEGYEAIFVASGAGLPTFLNIPRENLGGIYSANEFLLRVNLMEAYKFPAKSDTPLKLRGRVTVIGGGNVAIDAARCAIRLNAEEVYIIYRRTEMEMPARPDEVNHAQEEGVKFQFLTQPIKFIGDNAGMVKGIECIRMKLGSIDTTRRPRPIPVENSSFLFKTGTVIVAVGQAPNPLIARTTRDIKTSQTGTIIVDPTSYKTTLPRVYAGGDVVSGAATVISAMKAGKVAAQVINRKLKKE